MPRYSYVSYGQQKILQSPLPSMLRIRQLGPLTTCIAVLPWLAAKEFTQVTALGKPYD